MKKTQNSFQYLVQPEKFDEEPEMIKALRKEEGSALAELQSLLQELYREGVIEIIESVEEDDDV